MIELISLVRTKSEALHKCLQSRLIAHYNDELIGLRLSHIKMLRKVYVVKCLGLAIFNKDMAQDEPGHPGSQHLTPAQCHWHGGGSWGPRAPQPPTQRGHGDGDNGAGPKRDSAGPLARGRG